MINNLFGVILIAIVLSGCTIVNGSSIVTGEARDSIKPDDVRIFRAAPEQFNEIAIVSVSAGHDFKSNEGLLDSAVERLREEAAELGANGVILTVIDERDSPSVSTSYGSAVAAAGGEFATVSGNAVSVDRGDTYTRLRGIAIYVPTK